MPGVHALLSASGAKKWLNCPKSAVLEKDFPDKESTYALEGTTAHTLGELKIRLATKEITKAKYHKCVKSLNVDAEMDRYTDDYCDFVLERLNHHRKDGTCTLLLEEKLDFSSYVPKGYGTGDALIITSTCMEIIDLKYGKGIPVSVEHNPQLLLYALGALDTYESIFDQLDRVQMTIYQPRIDNISTTSVDPQDVVSWGMDYVTPRAKLAYSGDDDCIAGKHCDEGFCKARPVCRAYADSRLELAALDFKSPHYLNVEEFAEVIEQAETLAKWATMVKDYALDRMLSGDLSVPGYKLVAGRSRRCFDSDDSTISKLLHDQGCTDQDIYKIALRTVADMEKTLSREMFDNYVKPHIVKTPGNPTIAPTTDRRPELNSANSAESDFANVDLAAI